VDIDFARLREVDELFAVRWEAFALASLANGPLRYRQLWRAVRRHTQADINDTTFARLVKKLVAAEFVVQTPANARRPSYALTPQGQGFVQRIVDLIEAMDLLSEAVQAPDVEADS
jgi:DNA-binding HxlR family transcriptional regulator